jgi:acyl carrier protein
MTTKQEIHALVVANLAEVFGFPPESLTPATRLVEDLDLDSIDAVEMVVCLEKKSGFSFTGPELRSVRTVQDIVDVIHAREHAAAEAPAPSAPVRVE